MLSIFGKLSSLSLKTKISAAVMLLVWCGIWMLTFIITGQLKQDMTAQIMEQQFSTASYLANIIEEQVKHRFNVLNAYASAIGPELISNPVKASEILKGRILTSSIFQTGVAVVSKEGKVITDYPVIPGRAGGQIEDPDFIRDVVTTKEPSVGKPRTGKFSKKPIIPFAVPVFDRSNKVIAVMAGFTSLSAPTLLGTIERSAYKDFPDRFLVVSRRYRMCVTGSDPTRIMEPVAKPEQNLQLDRFIAGYEGSGITVSKRGVRILASVKQIPAAGWFFRVGLPTKILFAPIRRMHIWIYSIAPWIITLELVSSMAYYQTNSKTTIGSKQTDRGYNRRKGAITGHTCHAE
jgi:hypothetical protein